MLLSELGLVYTPASGSEDYDGPSTAFEGGLHSSDSGDFSGVRGQRSEAAQLLEQLVVENGPLCFPADLKHRETESRGERLTEEWSFISGHLFRCAHRNTHRVHHCNCLHREQSLGGLPR